MTLPTNEITRFCHSSNTLGILSRLPPVPLPPHPSIPSHGCAARSTATPRHAAPPSCSGTALPPRAPDQGLPLLPAPVPGSPIRLLAILHQDQHSPNPPGSRAFASPSRPHTLKITMSGMASDDAPAQVSVEGDVSDKKVEEVQDQNEVSRMPSRQEEEAVIKKKYGGILPRKTPLISKDHERAYFDSADWALGKQGGVPNKPKGPLEALRPKLQPTQQNARARRTSYASADSDETLNLSPEDLIPQGEPSQQGEPAEDKNKE